MYQTSEKPTVRIAEFSARWEGRTIDGVFLLRQFLGSGENSAVFLTSYQERPAAIKLLHVEPGKADAQLAQWRAAAKLSHPNLIRLYRMGQCELDALPLVFVVMEYAEEDLSQVLPLRSLTAEETREMLAPTLGALDYLHKQGFVHAHLRPSNIMAIDDCLKLSSDGLSRAGTKDELTSSPYDPPERLSGVVSPAGDAWSLGMTLIEVLTGRRPTSDTRPPADLPEPFSTIVRHSLERDARERWTIPQVSKYLADPEGATAVSAEPARRKRIAPTSVLILLALVVVVVAGVMIRQMNVPPSSTTPTSTTGSTSKAPEPPPAQAEPPKPEPVKLEQTAKREEPAHKPEPAAETTKPDVAEKPVHDAGPSVDDAGAPGQPMPEVMEKARSTIRGKVKVNVRVDVDPTGAVTDAKIEGTGGGRYFSDLAMKTVRQWKFEPVKVNGSQTGQRWRVRFEFQKSGTTVQRQRLSP
jgi:TonB family protein